MVAVYKSTDLDEKELSTLETRFQTFHQYRGVDGLWNRLVMRKLPTAIPASLAIKQDGIDYQSPDSARAIREHKAVCQLNPIHFDYHVPGTTKSSRDLERDHLLAKSTWFNRDINPQRRWEDRTYEGLIRHGIKVEWLRPKECPDMEEHADAYEHDDGCPNYFHNALLDGNYWTDEGDDGGADCHYYRYSVPVYGSNIENKDGDKVTLDSLGKIGWLGADEPHDYKSTGTKSVDIIVR